MGLRSWKNTAGRQILCKDMCIIELFHIVLLIDTQTITILCVITADTNTRPTVTTVPEEDSGIAQIITILPQNLSDAAAVGEVVDLSVRQTEQNRIETQTPHYTRQG